MYSPDDYSLRLLLAGYATLATVDAAIQVLEEVLELMYWCVN